MAAPSLIFDGSLIAARRQRALSGIQTGNNDAGFLFRAAADDLLERLSGVKRDFRSALDLGSPFPVVADALNRLGIPSVTDLDPLSLPVPAGSDPELFPLENEAYDLVVSALYLQWVNDLPGMLSRIRRTLRPDGLFLANLLGGDTLSELRESLTAAEVEMTGGASPRVAPFVELRQAGALLQRAGFALPVIDQDRLTVRYDNPLALMKDLRAMGSTNALHERSRKPPSRAFFLRAAEIYAERFADPDGRVRATFDIISLSGWAPHESQQKPLRPGSAKSRLADALGVREQPAGEKSG